MFNFSCLALLLNKPFGVDRSFVSNEPRARQSNASIHESGVLLLVERPSMWKLCFERLPFVRIVCRTSSTNHHVQSVIDKAIQRLTVNYQHELEACRQNEETSSSERMQYLKFTLTTMAQREKILRDIDETQRLSQGRQWRAHAIGGRILLTYCGLIVC